jgi:hypothetical protein
VDDTINAGRSGLWVIREEEEDVNASAGSDGSEGEVNWVKGVECGREYLGRKEERDGGKKVGRRIRSCVSLFVNYV